MISEANKSGTAVFKILEIKVKKQAIVLNLHHIGLIAITK